jgi:hypothetical protein
MNNSGPLTVARTGRMGLHRAQIVNLLEARLTELKGRPKEAALS